MKFLSDPDDALDHLEEFQSHAGFIHAVRPQPGDHVYISRVEKESPWLIQHHGIVVPGPARNTVRICHFSPCDSFDAKITISTIMAFTSGSDLLLNPSKAVRMNPARFAEACVGKNGFDAKTFNCEHFVNICITCESVSHMNTKAFLVAMSVAGSVFTLFGGVVGAAVWMAGKTAIVGKLVYDRYSSTKEVQSDLPCECCGNSENVVVVPKCKHNVCLRCGSEVGRNEVCPIRNCYESFFQFTVRKQE